MISFADMLWPCAMRLEVTSEALAAMRAAAAAAHPHEACGILLGPAAPSATDRASASGDGRVWAISGAGDITFWRDGEAGFAALSFCLAGG